ncbi:MAG: PA2779 family protein [Acidobacteria bacterium]|nr:PA2779 family protein [Acidobacteriota bacterium]
MPSTFCSFLRVFVACFMTCLFALAPQNLAAQTHVVSPSDLRQATVAATEARQANVARLNEFLSAPLAQQALREAHIDQNQVKTAISHLNDQDLATLAARADKAQRDFAAGAITNHLLLLIVLAIVVIIIIIVAEKA